MNRIRKYSVIFRHYQFRTDFIINRTLHKSSETQRMIFGNPLFFIVQIFIHIDKPHIFQTDILLINHIHKIRILSYRAYRTDKYCLLSLCIMHLNLVHHFNCHRVKYRCIILHNNDRKFRIISHQFFLRIVIITMSHIAFLPFISSLFRCIYC